MKTAPFLLGGLCLLARASAQPSAPNPSAEQIIQLNPFEVQADSDKSYGALNSNSVTRFNVELSKLPISADIFTQAFMNDTASTSVEDMIRQYSAGAGFEAADPGANSYDNQPVDRIGGALIRLRGLQTPVSVRDGFAPLGSFGSPGSTGSGFTSSFDVERVELIRGPQALLYGGGGGGGVINVVSKQARLGQAPSASAKFQVDQYGDKLGQFDASLGSDRIALRIAATSQTVGGRRINIGGPMDGLYAQLAVKTLWDTTTVRVSVEKTAFHRMSNSNSSVATSSATFDARSGDNLHYLLATNQITAAANGAASGSGPIDNGLVNWSNVDSYEGWDQSEVSYDQYASLTADSRWSSWLSTQLAVGYSNFLTDQDTAGFTFNAPQASVNTLGVWAARQTPSDTWKPSRTKALRFSALATNDLFRGAAHSQTIVGADFIRSDSASIIYQYYLADGNFNPIYAPAVTTLNGRTTTPLIWSIANGPVEYPNFRPATARVTYGGQNYVRMIENLVNPAAISPNDPLGVTLGGASYSHSNVINKGLYGINDTQWWNGKLDTLLGFRYEFSHAETLDQGAAPPAINVPDRIAQSRTGSFNVGANYELASWLRPYFSVSDSFQPPVNQTNDPAGNQPKTAHALGEEVGLKLQNASGTLSGSVALYHVDSRNEQYEITSSVQGDINPKGLNGSYGTAGNFVSVNRLSQGGEVTLTAAPTAAWRLRFSGAVTNGSIGSTTNFAQLYNDQFFTNAAGQVTYATGTPVYVLGTATSAAGAKEVAATAAGAVPLTLALLNNSTSLYYANPVSITGAINSSSAAAKILTAPLFATTQGQILTGTTGLPISQIQINAASNPTLANYVAPPGSITTSQTGDVTTGYPEFSFNATSVYTMPSGWLKGLKAGGSVGMSWRNRTNYYYTNGVPGPGAARTLFSMPNQWRADLILGYARRLRRLTWSTQLNVNNVFNHYEVVLLPNGNSGWTPTGVNATFTQQPRDYVWSTSVEF